MIIKVIVHEAEEGGYWAEVPSIQGCVTQADNYDDLIKNIHEAIEGCLSIDIETPAADDNARILELAI